jgi:hypothetical protein
VKKAIAAIIAVVFAVPLLAACPGGGGVKGTVLNIYGEQETKATMQCWDKAWSLSIDTDGTEAGIKRVCVTESQAKKYVVGSTYP